MGRREYLSLDALKFLTQSRRDDLISMIYTIFMLQTTYKLTDEDKILNSTNLCSKLNMMQFKPVTHMIFSLEY